MRQKSINALREITCMAEYSSLLYLKQGPTVPVQYFDKANNDKEETVVKKRTTRYLFAVLLLATPGLVLAAQSYPARPVRIVVPVPAGGGVDALARVVGQHLNAMWGHPFIVDNRPGAGGSLGAQIVSRATPDGYTLMVSSSSYVTNAAVRKTS